MKNFLTIFSIALTSLTMMLSCQSSQQTKKPQMGVLGENDCRVSKLTIENKNLKLGIEFVYNEKNQVVEVKRTSDEYDNGTAKITYSESGDVTKYELYREDTLSLYETIFWDKDRALVSLYEMEEGIWVNQNKIALTYDAEGQLILLDDYHIDSNNVWSVKGTLYDYIWDEGNITEISNYLVQDSLENESARNEEISFLMVSINHEDYIVDTYAELELFYTSEFEYYDIPNPLNHLSIAKTIVPTEHNCSRSLVKKVTKNYSTGEVVSYNYTPTLNKKGYPISVNMEATYVGEDETFSKSFKAYIEYDNCQ